MKVIRICFGKEEMELYEKIRREAEKNFSSKSSWLKKAAVDRINSENHIRKNR